MAILGTNDVVSRLQAEGFHVSKSRIESFLASGKVPPPELVGTSRAWTDDDIARVRARLVALDGRPELRNEGEARSTATGADGSPS
ncbi:hypothetical protein LCGC14_2338780 [marine sediment metagenome]|uniref:Uncharacterized protein n=1 Tax=marine sediment metagenome TaxID=412755 RepID=A0A0F9CCI2_9ZZZZ